MNVKSTLAIFSLFMSISVMYAGLPGQPLPVSVASNQEHEEIHQIAEQPAKEAAQTHPATASPTTPSVTPHAEQTAGTAHQESHQESSAAAVPVTTPAVAKSVEQTNPVAPAPAAVPTSTPVPTPQPVAQTVPPAKEAAQTHPATASPTTPSVTPHAEQTAGTAHQESHQESSAAAVPVTTPAVAKSVEQTNPVAPAPAAVPTSTPVPTPQPVAQTVPPVASAPVSRSSGSPEEEHNIESVAENHSAETPPATPSFATQVHNAPKITSGIGFHDGDENEEDSEAEKDVIDTVGMKAASGNWVFKNYWWRKIEDLYSKIKEAFNQVMESRMTYFSKRSETDKDLDRFYQHVGLEQGPLEDIINLALDIIERNKKQEGFLNKKEQAFLEKIHDKQNQLEQLKADVKAIEQLDQKIDEALQVVLQQVDACSKYEQQAWETFKEVARELSDKEARKQYYEAKGLLEDIQKVQQYLKGSFDSYFEQMIRSVQEHTQSIVAKLGALANERVDLKKEAHIFEQEEDTREKELAERKKEAETQTKKPESKPTSSVWSSLSNWWNSSVQWVKGLFGGGKKTVKAVPQAPVSSTAPTTAASVANSTTAGTSQVAQSVQKEPAKKLSTTIWSSIGNWWNGCVNWVKGLFGGSKETIKAKPQPPASPAPEVTPSPAVPAAV